MTTFSVSEVELSREHLPATTLAQSLQLRTQRAVEAGATNLPDLVEGTGLGHHPFVEAVHVAFAEHYPLVLSPDDVWLCLAQGFATHVNEHAEALRDRFVQHAGKPKIIVIRNKFIKGSPDNDWTGCFTEFSDAIAKHVGKKRDLVVADFSTTGIVERAASEIVLMSAMQAYFTYEVHTRCGIPAITLLGTTADWRAIRRRAEVFAEFDVGWWTAALLPVLDQFIAASTGKVDGSFWSSFYKLDSGSGGPYVNGWINVLFPYLSAAGRQGRVTIRNESARLLAAGEQGPRHGPSAGAFPPGFSMAPFLWKYLGRLIPMEILGGFTGVSQDPKSLALRPAIGWAVREAVGTE